MGLKPKFTTKQFDLELQKRREIIEKLIMTNLSVLGVKAVNHARTNRGYRDQTANLVNSTGFVLLKDGQNVYEDFQRTASGPEPTNIDGVSVGRSLANEIASSFNNFKGWALIIVAGMEYAASVEYRYGKNVLAATELLIRQEMPATIQKIKLAASKIKV